MEGRPVAAPLLIALPHGLIVSGITTWALRVSEALALRGRRVGILAHDPAPGAAEVAAPVAAGVELVRLRGAPPIDHAAGDLGPYLGVYRDVLRGLADQAGGPVVFSPNLSGECYGIAAEISRSDPGLARVVAWQHNHIEYDFRTLEYFEPLITRFVPVSRAIEAELGRRIPGRGGDVRRIPYGVPVRGALPARVPLDGRALRLIYTGRIEHAQKRIGVLPRMSEALTRLGVAHELTIVGAGPASAEIDRWCDGRAGARRVAAEPDGVARLLRDADVFVLPSRFEGLSVSMLEAMAAGCVPVVARVESGAAEAVADGESGLLIEAPGPDTEAELAARFAAAIAGLTPERVSGMSAGAWRVARERYSIGAHADAVARVIDEAAGAPARVWPGDRACSPHGGGAGSMTVPADAPERVAAALGPLAGKRVAIYGAGRHTVACAGAIRGSMAEVVALIDDDPARWGSEMIGLRVVSPVEAARMGVEAVVLSSHMHEGAMMERARGLLPKGASVVALYAAEGCQLCFEKVNPVHRNEPVETDSER